MNLLVLKGFNNYFNRKIKKYANLVDYIGNSTLSYTFSNINFDPNDGVATSQIIGSENQVDTGGSNPEPLKWEFEGTPDYIVCYETETVDDTTVVHIRSRWFVLECVRVRNGQYKLALKRDVIADHLEQILTNPCFVEKGYVAPNDPLIFNDEGVSLNQIKNYKGNNPEVMLKDATGIPWIVMYLAKNFPASNTPGVDANGSLPIEGQTILDTSQAIDVSELPWYNIISTINTAKTYRIPGDCEISISPIAGAYVDQEGVAKYIADPVRYNHRCAYRNNDWVKDENTTNLEYLGTTKNVPVFMDTFTYKVLDTKTLGTVNSGQTTSNTTLNWGPNSSTNGKIACWARKVDTFYSGSDHELPDHFFSLRSTWGPMGEPPVFGMLNPNVNTAANITYIKNYLNTKKTWLETNLTHSPKPGEPNTEAYAGGNQAFLKAEDILYYNGKLIKSGANYFKLKVTRAGNYKRKIDYFINNNGTISVSSANNLGSYIGKALWSWDYFDPTDYRNPDNTMVETSFDHTWFDIQYEKVTGDLLRFTLPSPSSRNNLNDAAYDMLVFPYGAIDFKVPNNSNPPTADLSFTSSKEASIGIARSIAAKVGSSLYDMQLLPYCPYRQVAEQYAEDGYIDIGKDTPFTSGAWSGVYQINSSGDTPSRANSRSFGLWCINSHGTFNIDYQIEMPEETSEAYKVFNTCKKFRLVSPNYSSSFEFNPLKNNGVSIFNVDFNYRPFNSYIHVSPVFDGLYGVDTNDNRGLILQGDFSIGYYSDAWANYQIQNANYANIFNRQIENIDFNQAQEREKQTWNNWTTGITEALGLGGGLQGAKAFSGLGPWGMLGGGIGGTVGGMVGAGVGLTKDWEWLTESQKEEKSYAVDMYNYSLGNVKALPYGLAKSDALTENFKYFPFIEVYDCTDKEVELFKAKLLYDGMTVGAIGELQSYIPPEGSSWNFQRLKGRLIMQESLVDDFQIANAIYTEVNKGFYYVNQYRPLVEEDSD